MEAWQIRWSVYLKYGGLEQEALRDEGYLASHLGPHGVWVFQGVFYGKDRPWLLILSWCLEPLTSHSIRYASVHISDGGREELTKLMARLLRPEGLSAILFGDSKVERLWITILSDNIKAWIAMLRGAICGMVDQTLGTKEDEWISEAEKQNRVTQRRKKPKTQEYA